MADDLAIRIRLAAWRIALERQRADVAKWLAFFTRMFMQLAIGGALLAAIYGLCAGNGHHPTAAPTVAKAALPIAAAPARRPFEPPLAIALRETADRFAAMLLALSIAGAAAATGAAAGFLFGLPRTLTSGEVRTAAVQVAAATGQTTNPAAPPAAKIGINTNLEQISDWLTKIIVGVGLTNLNALPDSIGGFGDRVDGFFGVGGKVFGIGAGIYFLSLGFFIGYVLTRTKLTWLFAGSAGEVDVIAGQYRDPAMIDAVKLLNSDTLDAKTAPLNPTATATATASLRTPEPGTPAEVTKAGATLLAKPLGSLNSSDEIAARAAAEARAGRIQDAATLYGQLVRENPRGGHLVDYATVLGLLGDKAKANDILGTIRTLAPGWEAEARTLVLVGLLRAGLYDGKFEQSIEAGEELVAQPGQDADPWVQLWLACAHGQKHKTLPNGVEGDAARKTERDRVVALVTRAIDIAPEMKDLVRELYDPARIKGGDNDLESLWRDDELDRILGVTP